MSGGPVHLLLFHEGGQPVGAIRAFKSASDAADLLLDMGYRFYSDPDDEQVEGQTYRSKSACLYEFCRILAIYIE